MPNPAEPKFHHYIPRFILQRFSHRQQRDESYVAVMDKLTGRRFSPNIDGIMGETHFNRIALKNGDYFSLEGFTASIDNIAAPVVAKLVDARSLAGLDNDDRAKLCMSVALQMLRGTGPRNMFVDAVAQLRAKLASVYGEANLPDEVAHLPNEDDRKREGIVLTLQSIEPYSDILLGKDMLLMHPPRGETYLLGDNPVVLDNSGPRHPIFGNLGLVSEGIEIYVPLSPTLQLCFWCPSIRRLMQEHAQSARHVTRQIQALTVLGATDVCVKAIHERATFDAMAQYAESINTAIATGTPFEVPSQCMQRYNSLQVTTAERYVIAADEEFSFVEMVVRSSPHAKRGRRMKVS